MSPEAWLAEHAIDCTRHRGRWSRQACHDALLTAPELCTGCPIQPVKVEPSPAARSLLTRIRNHAFVRYGSRLSFADPCPRNTMERSDPYQDVAGVSDVLL